MGTPKASRSALCPPSVAIIHHLTEPRGGVFQCLHVAEGLAALGHDIHLFGLGAPEHGYFRPTSAPHTVLAAPPREGDHEERFLAAVNALTEQLRGHDLDRYDLVHVHDTIDAIAVLSLKLQRGPRLIRTIHHLEDVETKALREAQTRAVVEPDVLLTVSRFWQRRLREGYGRDSFVVTNGIDHPRLRPPPAFDRAAFRARVGAAGRFLFLTVGGISPRKGSLELFEALASVKSRSGRAPLLAIVGGHSLNSYASYRREVLDRATQLGLVEGVDYVFTGTIPERDVPAWYHAADALVFPSLREGWGLVILEAMATGLPVVATEIPVFREFLGEGDAVLVAPGSSAALADAMLRVLGDVALRQRLAERGPVVARPYNWETCVAQHREIYAAAAERVAVRNG